MSRTSSSSSAASQTWSASRFMRLGLITAGVLVLCAGSWSAFASISGAVVADGRFKVQGERQVVQHLDGGIVAQLKVREGDEVEAGDVLMQLDGRHLEAELSIVKNQLYQTLARIARLEAEQDGLEKPEFPPELISAAATDPEIATIPIRQTRLFQSRLERLDREREQLRERQKQIADELDGLEAEAQGLSRQLELVDDELRDQRSLLDRGLTQSTRVLSLERERARFEAELGSLTAAQAQARGRIAELDLEYSSLGGDRVEEAVSNLSDLQSTAADLRERRLELLETISRLDIRAPRDGVVLDLSVFTIGAVVQSGEPVMYIVPTEDDLVVEARIAPEDIDQVWPGQEARLRLAAANQRTTPELDAAVRRVSADSLEDPATRQPYYAAELTMTDEAHEHLEDASLVAGMPVDAFIQTETRSPISYLIRPISDYLARSWRER